MVQSVSIPAASPAKSAVSAAETEPILTENKSRYVMFPIHYPEIYAMYKKAVASYWTVEEVNFHQDQMDLARLTDNEKFFINHVLAFFAASDGIVNENLASRFLSEVAVAEAKAFYSFQIAMEAVHGECYSLLIESYVKDVAEKDRLFNAVTHFPAIAEKAQWALRWISDTEASFAQRLLAFTIVEGLFFSGAFCAIFWLRERGILPGLSFANQLISRDEALHCEFSALLYRSLTHKLPVADVHAMVREAVEIEERFITESLPCNLIGMNATLMKQYIHFIADRILAMINLPRIYNDENPFQFMEFAALEGKTNFFEGRPSEYSKAGVAVEGSFSAPTEFNVDLDGDF